MAANPNLPVISGLDLVEAINSAHLACCDSPSSALQTRTPTWLERSFGSEWAEPLQWCHRPTARGQKTHIVLLRKVELEIMEVKEVEVLEEEMKDKVMGKVLQVEEELKVEVE